MSNSIENLLKKINPKPIAYYPAYTQITGSVKASILLSELMYWFSGGNNKISKLDKEIMRETGLTKSELKGAKAKIKKLDFITVSVEGIPARTYYEIDWEKYEAMKISPTRAELLIDIKLMEIENE